MLTREKAPKRGSFDYLLETPPPPPEPGGGPRVRIEIEIVQRTPPAKPRGYRIGTITLGLIVILLWASLAHAQTWSQYRLGGTTYMQGTDQNGGSWTGQQYRLGGTTYGSFTGPNGESRNCSSYRLGSTTYTDCN